MKTFDIVFSGKLSEGSNPPEVLKKLSTLLGVDEARVREIFKPGAGAIIRKDLDGRTAYALHEKLQECGVICSVKEIETPAMDSSPPPAMQPPNNQSPRQKVLKPVRQPPPVTKRKSSGIISLGIKIILLAAIAWSGWWCYKTWFAPPTPAFTAYAGFADAMARGEYAKAADQAQGDARAYAERWVEMTRPTTMKVYGREYSMAPPSVSSIAGDIAWIKRKRKSEDRKTDSHVELQVEQTVCRIPPGVTSALCKWPVTFQHDVEVELIDGTWKVSGFKETRLTPQDK